MLFSTPGHDNQLVLEQRKSMPGNVPVNITVEPLKNCERTVAWIRVGCTPLQKATGRSQAAGYALEWAALARISCPYCNERAFDS
jgi:hypothetical protein